MSVNRDMRDYQVQERTDTRTLSGAKKGVWQDVRPIQAAVYKVNERRVSASIRYGEASHTGLTYCQEIRKNVNRLVRNGVVYEILDVNTEGRLTNLILKVVDADV